MSDQRTSPPQGEPQRLEGVKDAGVSPGPYELELRGLELQAVGDACKLWYVGLLRLADREEPESKTIAKQRKQLLAKHPEVAELVRAGLGSSWEGAPRELVREEHALWHPIVKDLKLPKHHRKTAKIIEQLNSPGKAVCNTQVRVRIRDVDVFSDTMEQKLAQGKQTPSDISHAIVASRLDLKPDAVVKALARPNRTSKPTDKRSLIAGLLLDALADDALASHRRPLWRTLVSGGYHPLSLYYRLQLAEAKPPAVSISVDRAVLERLWFVG